MIDYKKLILVLNEIDSIIDLTKNSYIQIDGEEDDSIYLHAITTRNFFEEVAIQLVLYKDNIPIEKIQPMFDSVSKCQHDEGNGQYFNPEYALSEEGQRKIINGINQMLKD